MTLISLLIIILILVVVFWLLSRYVVPALPDPIGKVVLAIVALLVILWLLSQTGLLPDLNVRLR